MRNLKKILALVLAMVMALSVMSVAGAFTDDEKFSGNYAEAAEVLEGLGVFQGYPDGSFRPEQTITRAEAAALIYRIASGDTGDANKELYKYNGPFTDVSADHWAAGYINYCANGEYIRGKSATIFDPEAKVTGYEVLAMILRVVGYDANKEFTGAKWETTVATTAESLGITGSVKGISLRDAAPRQIVAELLFRTLVFAPMVKYTAALGYQPVVTTPVVNVTAGTTTLAVGGQTLGQKVFKLTCGEDTTIDKWGRPGYYWFSDGNWVATIEEPYAVRYEKAVTECQIATDAGIYGAAEFDLFVNGVQSYDVIQATDTVDTMGAQGRITEVYSDRIVMIDTFLAQVTDVKDATYDAAGHLKTQSSIELTVFDDATNPTIEYTLTNGATNYPYVKGDMLLIHAYTYTGDRDGCNFAAPNKVSKSYTKIGTYAEILGKAESMQGTQTVIWYNANQHTVNGQTYMDAAEFHLDMAGNSTNNYVWYFDQFKNLIGNVEIATQYNYAAVTSIWWAGDVTTGAGKAMVSLKYMDGTTNTAALSSICLDNANWLTPTYSIDTTDVMTVNNSNKVLYVASYATTNAGKDTVNNIIGGHLFKVGTLADNSVALSKVWTDATPGTHAEHASVKITNRYGWIVDKTTNAWLLPIDTETKFLVNDGGKYTVYTGLNEIPTFSDSAKTTKVDYVLGAGGVADYVYVIGTPDSATTHDFVLITSKAYSAVLKDAGGVKYYEVVLPVPAEDGSAISLKVKASDKTAVLDVLTNISSVGKLFYVTYTDGYATGVIEVNNNQATLIGQEIYTKSGYNALKLTDAKMLTSVTGGVINGSVDGTANCRFNITAATTVVGTLEANMTNKVVYVIYNTVNNDVAKVYVLDINNVDDGPIPSADHTIFAVNVGKIDTPAKDTAIANVKLSVSAVAAYSNEDGTVIYPAASTVKATLSWEISKGDGKFVPKTAADELFVAGWTYRATVTLTSTAKDALTGQPYVLTDYTAIRYDAASDAGTNDYYGTSFTLDAFTVAE